MQLIKESFNEEEATVILSLPISTTQRRDRKVWHYSPNGVFTVKSAYCLEKESLINELDNHGAQTSSANVMALIWKKLRGLPIHPKIKFFAWKCFNEALATNSALTAKKCGFFHLFVLDLRSLKTVDICLTGGIVFAIKTRNDLVFNGTSWPAEAINGKAQADFFEFLEANVKPSPTQVASSNPETLVWKRPEEGMIKINVDAAVSKATSTIGTGAIARNASGSILGIFIKSYEGLTSPRLAKAMAIRNGMNLGVALNVGRVLIESDAESIVRSCSMSKNPPSDIAVLVQDCLALKDSFQLCDFKFCQM
ncbi:uncharacterized protein LOC131333014 [Rhododendron vialii]|uniref:uncharacterized protein LOC131333014 n=1 Tax=Rhododendron vialii TaxID=182163 RepID=UPI00265DB30A|nr:uncharacterized protein LOC131333014 [Rhododendron vialii]